SRWAGRGRVLPWRRRLARLGGLGDNSSKEPPENEATGGRESAATQGDYGNSPDQRQKEDRTADPQARRGGRAADGDLPRAERISGAGEGDLRSPRHHQQFANRPG